MRFKIIASLGFLSSLIINSTCKIKNSYSSFFASETNLNFHHATDEEISSFSNLVPNYQYFTKLNHAKTFGYMDVPDYPRENIGLCEYISLGMLLTYFELFVSGGFFSDWDWEWKKYYETNDSIDKPTMPIHKYYKTMFFDEDNYWKSLAYNLFKNNNYAKNIKSGWTILSAFTKFLEDKFIAYKIKTNYSAPWWHTSSPEDYLLKYNVPVMVSFTETFSFGHNVVIYGYDKETSRYLVHFGWSDCSAIIINKSDIWSLWSFGFWNAFYFESDKDKIPTRKAFRYQNQNYSWQELQEQGISWDQL